MRQYGIVVDGSKQSVGYVGLGIEHGERAPGYEFVGMLGYGASKKMVEVFGADAEVFAFAKTGDRFDEARIDDLAMFEVGSMIGEISAGERTFGEEAAELGPTFLVACDADEQQVVAVAKLDAKYWIDAVFATGLPKGKCGGGGVDIGEREG